MQHQTFVLYLHRFHNEFNNAWDVLSSIDMPILCEWIMCVICVCIMGFLYLTFKKSVGIDDDEGRADAFAYFQAGKSSSPLFFF
jgi:hypothetical protein